MEFFRTGKLGDGRASSIPAIRSSAYVFAYLRLKGEINDEHLPCAKAVVTSSLQYRIDYSKRYLKPGQATMYVTEEAKSQARTHRICYM